MRRNYGRRYGNYQETDLKRFFQGTTMPLNESVYGMTDVGKKRADNEDSFLLLSDKHLYIVSDGMGGHNAGDVASAHAVAALESFLIDKNLSVMMPDEIRKTLMDAVMSAHKTVLDLSRTKTEYSNMGCTLVLAFIHNNTLYTCHAGDSRAYVINHEEIVHVTTDHSVVMELVVLGKMTKEAARLSPMKNQITQALGLPHYFDPEYNRWELKKGDTVLLCTDGLWDMLSDAQIHELIILNNSAKEICKKLIDSANHEGGYDNITAVVITGWAESPLNDTVSEHDLRF